jgi:phosphonate transport system substrate-binding protein
MFAEESVITEVAKRSVEVVRHVKQHTLGVAGIAVRMRRGVARRNACLDEARHRNAALRDDYVLASGGHLHEFIKPFFHVCNCDLHHGPILAYRKHLNAITAWAFSPSLARFPAQTDYNGLAFSNLLDYQGRILKSMIDCFKGYRAGAALAAAVAVFALAGCGSDKKAEGGGGGGTTATSTSSAATLKIGVIPFEDISKIKDNYKPLADYLGKKCGGKAAEVFVTPAYSGVIEALRSDQIDCAYLNPLSYALAVEEFKGKPEQLVPLSMPVFHGSPTYVGIIFTRADSGINTIKDFKGRTFAFADRTSTSGYLYPAGLMMEAGIDPNRDVRAVNMGGSASVLAVFNKQADGGASYDTAIDMTLKDPAKIKQMKVIAKTDPIPNGMFVARGNIDPAELEELKAAMAVINNDPEGVEATKKAEYDKWIEPDDKFFDSVRKKATILGLKLSSLDEAKKQ